MSIRTFWTLFLKILGIFLLLDGWGVLMSYVSTLAINVEYRASYIEVTLVSLVIISSYVILIWGLFFKTNWIIGKLKLDKGFNEDRLNLNIPLPVILRIGIMILGGLLFINNLPLLFEHVASAMQDPTPFFRNSTILSWIVYAFIKVAMGLLIVVKGKWLAGFIMKSSSQKQLDEKDIQ